MHSVAHAWPTYAALSTRATSGQRPCASQATPAHLAWQYLDRKYLFFDQALPMRRAGVAHPWPTRGPPVAYPWPTRGPPVAQPLLVEVRRLGREEFCATWMPDLLDRPEIFPSFA